MTPRERGGWVWILAGLASSPVALRFAPGAGPVQASGVASALPWWMWFLPVIAVALPAALYWWRHRPTPPDAMDPGFPERSEEPGESPDPLMLDQDHPDLYFAS